MKNDAEIKKFCFGIAAQQQTLNTLLWRNLRGRWVEIVSNFNGQLYGCSKKCLTGKQYKIVATCIDNDGVEVLLDGLKVYCRLQDIKFLPTEEKL